MHPLLETLKTEAQDLFPKLVDWRRDFHMHPELGMEEVRTAGIVADHLRGLGLEVSTGIGQTGVVALVEPDDLPTNAPTVMVRFDMDALPIDELNDVPYRSTRPGLMHACGHDGHTAIGMGVAQLLTKHRADLPGRVKLVFQPGEEGHGVAAAMIADGVLENPTPDAAFALHLWSRLPLNQVVVQPGPLWASASTFSITITGKGGHGAMPHETIDATLIASHLVVALQSIVSRNLDPTETGVVSVCAFHSGSAANIISERAELRGTLRNFDDAVLDFLVQRIQEIGENLCRGFGAEFAFSLDYCTPATINDPAAAAFMRPVAEAVVGAENVTQIRPMMVAEDMSQFLNQVPGCFIMVGASDPSQPMHSPHHNPTFDFDERMMPTGVALLAGAAVQWLMVNG